MKLIKNKKATENWAPRSTIFFMIFVIVLGFSTVIFLLITNSFILKDIEIPKYVEEHILSERFYNSPECFAYQDESGRVYPKVIDWNKFSDKSRMEKCLSLNNFKYAFKLELEDQSTSGKASVTTSNWVNNVNFRLDIKNAFVYYQGKIINKQLFIYVQNV